jgi:hypothetical protein
MVGWHMRPPCLITTGRQACLLVWAVWTVLTLTITTFCFLKPAVVAAAPSSSSNNRQSVLSDDHRRLDDNRRGWYDPRENGGSMLDVRFISPHSFDGGKVID